MPMFTSTTINQIRDQNNDQNTDPSKNASTVNNTDSAPLGEIDPPTTPSAREETAISSAPLRMILAFGLPFLFAWALFGIRYLAQRTLPHIVKPGNYVGFQDVVDGLPVPRLLDWNVERIELLEWIRTLNGPLLWIVSLLLLSPIWLYAVRQINPTFRFFRVNPPTQPLQENPPRDRDDPSAPAPANSDPQHDTIETTTTLTIKSTTKSTIDNTVNNTVKNTGKNTFYGPASTSFAPSALSAPIEFHALIKAGTLFLTLGLPTLFLWLLIPITESTSQAENSAPLVGKVWLLRAILVSLAFWLGFHRDGLAGDFSEPEWNRQRRLIPLALRAILFGALVFLLCRFGLPQTLATTLLRLRTLGTFHIGRWNQVVGLSMLSFAATGFGVGTLFALFGRTENSRRHQLLLTTSTLVAWLVAWIAMQPLSPKTLRSRYDISPALLNTIPEQRIYKPDLANSGVPDTAEAAAEMARQLRLSTGEQPALPGHFVIGFDGPRHYLVFQNGYTIDRLTADEASIAPVTRFLQERNYESALSWCAVKHLFNMALIRYDNTAAMEVCLQDLTHNPHNTPVTNILSEMMSVAAATPQNIAILDRWADERNFSTPLRDTKRLVGDLYRRMGKPDKALQWYRKADMPASFLLRVSKEKPMFHNGTVEGRILLNGKPLRNARVGVVPIRMNGLPPRMGASVLTAFREIFAFDPRVRITGFAPFQPIPFRFRWVAASTTTDSDGQYRLTNLTEGSYTILCQLPADLKLRTPFDPRLQSLDAPAQFTLNYEHQLETEGTIRITVSQ